MFAQAHLVNLGEKLRVGSRSKRRQKNYNVKIGAKFHIKDMAWFIKYKKISAKIDKQSWKN